MRPDVTGSQSSLNLNRNDAVPADGLQRLVLQKHREHQAAPLLLATSGSRPAMHTSAVWPGWFATQEQINPAITQRQRNGTVPHLRRQVLDSPLVTVAGVAESASR
jgi:hypothetical protein